ncbi:trimeric intracellular cation channel type 1B.1-like [Artemia franciscana]|uniref:trimeric intracellular cation channel type 1B.1-like n=1 Tax=Artemia franciscana TaxID=6661 RepID=UPI0032D9CE55
MQLSQCWSFSNKFRAWHALRPTKACIAAAIVFVIDKKTDYISAPHALVYFGIVLFFVYFKLSSLLLGIHDPFLPFENLFCAVFMGGIFDAMQRAVSGKVAATADKNAAEKNGKAELSKKNE